MAKKSPTPRTGDAARNAAGADFDDVAPDASSMIESMRAHGYTLPTALADLIDNSIAARAKNIWLDFAWSNGDPWISVTDDGVGMAENELVAAMRLGSRSPLARRDPSDLGRFGLGLKTASFSQARRLTVVTRPKAEQTFLRRWDLDYLAQPDVKGWQLLRTRHDKTGQRADLLDKKSIKRGTQVLLERLDRIAIHDAEENAEKDRQDHFLWLVERVREHLAMVFHRFLLRKSKGVSIHLNDERIVPWDPFLETHPSTQLLGSYSRELKNHDASIRVRGFVLPHRDRFRSLQEHQAAGGPRGWNDQQGFYLFRGDRLIIAGDWLQLRWQKEEHYKLARIELDIPNSMDLEWQIDVKKSSAAPPAALRNWLKGVAQEVRQRAKEVYSHRGKYGARRSKATEHRTPWKSIAREGGEFSYRIDRQHPVLVPLIQSLSRTHRSELDLLLRLIEETVPVRRIWIDTAENQEGASLPFAAESSSNLKKVILACYQAQIEIRKVAPKEAWDQLAEFEGFQTEEAQAIIGELRS